MIEGNVFPSTKLFVVVVVVVVVDYKRMRNSVAQIKKAPSSKPFLLSIPPLTPKRNWHYERQDLT